MVPPVRNVGWQSGLMAKATTIRDVAALAGVSIATVSRVLNGTGYASGATAEKVRAAMAALSFRPSTIGRSLKAAQTRTIGVMVPTLSNPVFAESVGGVQDAAAEAGYGVLIASTDYRSEREASAMNDLLSHRVDALVLTVADADHSPLLDALDSESAPYVLIYNHPQTRRCPFVAVDNEAAARAVVQRMIALGHRRIGMVAGGFQMSDRSRQRHAGYCAALAEAGLPAGPVVEVDFADTHLARRLAPVLQGPNRPSALFVSNDVLALATIRAVRDLGLSVPDQVSVTGFDGTAFGALVQPSLATVVQPARAMGRAAFAAVAAQLEGEAAGGTLFPFVIRRGDSLGPAPDTAFPFDPLLTTEV